MESLMTRTIAVQTLIDQLRSNCERPFSDARAMPPGVYTSPEFLALEESDIFAREWQCVGRASALKEPGDYLTAQIGAQPIVVLRDEHMQLKAMSNVCLHRMSVLLEGRGNKRRIVCPYHAWSYGLDGELKGAPLMDRQEGFCKESYKLPAMRCEEWQGSSRI
jgi:choline monooxygenase